MASLTKRARFLGADIFLSNLTFYRLLSIEGRYGGGKTALATILAAYLLEAGYVDTVVSNVEINFAIKPEAPLKNSCIVMDEAWIYLSKRAAVFEYAAFLRKFNHYLLMPSVWPPNRLLTRFSVERIFNCFSLGLPAWLYSWQVIRGNVKDRGKFLVWHPEAVFGYYDTDAIPADDGGIYKVIQDTCLGSGFDLDKRQNRKDAVYEQDEEGSEFGEEIEAAVAEFGEAVDQNEAVAARIEKSLAKARVRR
jgi:hypothetical protein